MSKKEDTMSEVGGERVPAMTETEETPAATGKEAPAKAEKKGKRALLVFAALFSAIALLAVGWVSGYFSIDRRVRSLAEMVETVRRNYYEEVDRDTLYDNLYDGLALDEFCAHYTEEEYAAILAEGEGRNTGYGLSLLGSEARARVYRTVYNSPAERAGLESGMYIFACGTDGQPLREGGREEILAFLRANDSCVLSVGYREDGSDARTVAFSRADYLASYCMYADSEGTFRFRGESELVLERVGEGMSFLPADTAYLRLTEFDGNAAEEFVRCLEEKVARGRKHLVLDLRSNGGGYMTTLCSIASHLLKGAEGARPVVATAPTYNGGYTYRADGNDYATYFSDDAHITVLADENTASASESLMGAMLSYGTISPEDIYLRDGAAGPRTYGKGVMQAHFTASDGNVMRITVSRVYWPDGTCIHREGIRAVDAAHAIAAPVLPSEEDEFLAALF